jgi:hypothetical protein
MYSRYLPMISYRIFGLTGRRYWNHAESGHGYILQRRSSANTELFA